MDNASQAEGKPHKVSPAAIKATLKSIDSQAPTLTYYGLAFWMLWNAVGFSGAFWLHESDNSSVAEILILAHVTACIVTLILAASASEKIKVRLVSNEAMFIGAAVATVGSLGIILVNPDISLAVFGPWLTKPMRDVIFIICCVLTGCSTTMFFLRAAALFGSLPPRQALCRFSSCALISSAAFFVMEGSPLVISNVMFVLLPLCSAVLYSVHYEGAPEGIVLRTKAKTDSNFVLFLLSLALISLTLEMMKSYILIETPASTNLEDYSLSHLISIAVALVLMLATFLMKSRDKGFIRIYSSITAAITIITLLFIIFFQSFTIEFASILSAGTPLFSIVVYGILAYIVYQSQAEAIMVFALGNVALSVGTVIGAATMLLFQNGVLSQEFMQPILVFLGLSVLVDVVFVFNEKRLQSIIVPIDEDRLEGDKFGRAEVKKPAYWKEAVDRISRESGMTAREQEIFKALAKGKTAQQIADEDTLSIYTVRAHIRNIYTKLGVHSKTELQKLVDGKRD